MVVCVMRYVEMRNEKLLEIDNGSENFFGEPNHNDC